jgi:hypothetical protein
LGIRLCRTAALIDLMSWVILSIDVLVKADLTLAEAANLLELRGMVAKAVLLAFKKALFVRFISVALSKMLRGTLLENVQLQI